LPLPRALTGPEQTQARSYWPRMAVANVVVTDEPTERYNCLAWTLGITTSWIWPWGSRPATKAEFDALYRSYGFSPATAGPIAAFGLSQVAMQHGSISGPGHGPRWESKAGNWLRIQHGLAEMEGGTVYGDVRGFYSRSNLRAAEPADARLSRMLSTQTMMTLTAEQGDLVRARAASVDRPIRDRFDAAYAEWRATWSHPLVIVSSAPIDRSQSLQFLELVALGPDIVPLLMEKLLDPTEFFALVAVDRLIPPTLVVVRELDDDVVLQGEQGRAIETVQRWIASVA
jgi:hypothetical protein